MAMVMVIFIMTVLMFMMRIRVMSVLISMHFSTKMFNVIFKCFKSCK